MEPALVLALAAIAASSVALGAVAAAETALERANDVRIQALASRGDPRACRIAGSVGQPQKLLGSLTVARVLFAALLVATFAYLGARAYSPLAGAIGVGMAGGVYVSLIQMTVGLVAARRPEAAALQMSQVVRIVGPVFAVPAWFLGLPARLVARFLRVVVAPGDATDILTLVEREEATGGVEEQEKRMIRGVISLEDRTAREIMIPRIDIAAADVEDSIADVAAIVNERGYSRVPVFRENIDDIVGIVYAKDLLRSITNGGAGRDLASLLRPAVFVPESKHLDQLLSEMRGTRQHMAIVVDEYGGTAGLVTIEDLLEEIVGEIEDEYDIAAPGMEVLSDDEVILDAGSPAEVLRDLFGLDVESEDFDTVGGYLIHELGRLPAVGDEVKVGPLSMRVLSMSGRRVRRMRIERARMEEPQGTQSR